MTYPCQPATAESALAVLAEPLRAWFTRRHPFPTLCQRLAWPAIASGANLLVSAPTGTGKTLAALLPILTRMLSTSPSGGHATATPRQCSCLYIAPQRALCNDALANLRRDLHEALLDDVFRVGLRTGDSKGRERRSTLTDPPHLLITTPESLALLLSQQPWRNVLAEVEAVIVDEVHELAATKRGADLSISLERLAALTRRDPQRIGLSATCVPLDEIARWLGGEGRAVRVACVPDDRPLDLEVAYLPPADVEAEGFVAAMFQRLIPLLEEGGTTLVFTNVRSMAERLAWTLRRWRPDWAAEIGLHHSALSALVRLDAEQRLKAGKLRVVFTSTSLELGIDVGSIDKVVLVHPPGGATRLLQRLGRSGHGPGRLRCGLVFTSTPSELLEAAATGAAGAENLLERLNVPSHPLDVLCQQLLGMAVGGRCTAAEAWQLVRRAYPYRHLPFAEFASCLQYLAGGHAAAEVPARIRWHDHAFEPISRRVTRIYRQNAGTLNSEPSCTVQLPDGRPLGQVSAFFADRLQMGDRFLLDGTCMELTAAQGDAITVSPTVGVPTFTRWHGGSWPLPQALAERIWFLRVRARDALLDGTPALRHLLQEDYGLTPATCEVLVEDLLGQETQSEIPDDGLLVEVSPGPEGEGVFHAFHLPLAPSATEAVARVLTWRMPQSSGFALVGGCLGFGLWANSSLGLDELKLRGLLDPAGFERDLERAVLQGQAAAQRFQAVATTGMMLLRQPLRRRRRVGGHNWAGRRLMQWLRFTDPQFPLLRQAVRETREEVYDAGNARRWLERLQGERIAIRCLPALAPFAEAWIAQGSRGGDSQHRASGRRLGTSDGVPPDLAEAHREIEVHRDWLLTAQRAAVHRPTSTAVIADLHLGYDAVRRAAGEAVPELNGPSVLRRVQSIVRQYDIRRLVVAGDLVEDGRFTAEAQALADWLAERRLEFWLVPGNHDRGLPQLRYLQVWPKGVALGDWHVVHEGDLTTTAKLVVGHIHPVVRHPALGTLPCYLLGANRIVLPAFSEDAAGLNVSGSRLWADAAVVAIVRGRVQNLGTTRAVRRRFSESKVAGHESRTV